MVTQEIIRFTYQGTSYRLKIPQILNLSDYDYLKVLFYIVNQETRFSITDCLQAMDLAADLEYMKQITNQAIGRDLVRFEKHMIWTRYLLFKSQVPDFTFMTRSQITIGCRATYQEILLKAEDMLLNDYGLVFKGYANKTGFSGTAYTLARMAFKNLIDKEVLNGIGEQERRYCS